MPATARQVPVSAVHSLRERSRREAATQITKDSVPFRGWTHTYLLEDAATPIGFGSVAHAGPWKDSPTIIEFYLIPERRTELFAIFETFLAASGARSFELQTNVSCHSVVLLTYARDITPEAIVFADTLTTRLTAPGAALRRTTSDQETHACIAERAGHADYVLELNGHPIGHGALLFHYNVPYADISMDIDEPHRRQGYGAFLVQKLKAAAYALSATPAARCNVSNLPSRKTLTRAGLSPVGHILLGTLK